MRLRHMALLAVVALIGSLATTAVAQDLPDPDELAQQDGVQIAEEAEEEAEQDADPAQEDAEADEEAEADEDAEADDEERADEWETPLRDRIRPVINEEGHLGFHGIASAFSPGEFQFQTGLFGRATGGSDLIRHRDEHRTWTGNVLVNASFHEHFGAHFKMGARNNVNTFGRPEAMLSHGDMTLGFTGRFMAADGVALGGDLGLFVPTAFGDVGIELPSTSVRPRLQAGFDFDEMMGAQPDMYVPLVAHLNIGYRIDNSEGLLGENGSADRIERYAYGISTYDLVEFGLGAEFPLPYVTPFLGWNLGIPVNAADEDVCADDRPLDCVADAGAGSFPQRLSLGAKAEPVRNLGLHLGMDIGLTSTQAEGLPATMPYEFHFGVSWHIDPAGGAMVEPEVKEVEKEVQPPRGFVHGRLVDEESGEPVGGASINYIDRDLTQQLSDSESGLFQSYDFEPGEEVVFEIDHPNYEVEYVDWIVEEGSDELEVAMEATFVPAVITGSLVGADGAPLSGATVVMRTDAGEVYEIDTDGNGNFGAEIDGDAATIGAAGPDWGAVGDYVQLEPGGEYNVELAAFAVEEWHAERTDDRILLGEDVSFEDDGAALSPEADAILDQVAALILSSPEVAGIEVQGHTADDGDDSEMMALSIRRAEAVQEALVERGLSPERLDAEGYGANRPIVPNTSDRNRELNRRVEFHFVD